MHSLFEMPSDTTPPPSTTPPPQLDESQTHALDVMIARVSYDATHSRHRKRDRAHGQLDVLTVVRRARDRLRREAERTRRRGGNDILYGAMMRVVSTLNNLPNE